MPRKKNGRKRKGAGRNNIERRLRSIESNMVRLEDLSRIYDDLDEIKQSVVRKRRKRLSLFSRKREDGDVDQSASAPAKGGGPLNNIDIGKAVQLAQNPMIQKMIKNML